MVYWWLELSVELPEAYLLAKQMKTEFVGKTVAAFTLQNWAKYQDLGFINAHQSDFQQRRPQHERQNCVSCGSEVKKLSFGE
jgi:hypothetical protein